MTKEEFETLVTLKGCPSCHQSLEYAAYSSIADWLRSPYLQNVLDQGVGKLAVYCNECKRYTFSYYRIPTYNRGRSFRAFHRKIYNDIT